MPQKQKDGIKLKVRSKDKKIEEDLTPVHEGPKPMSDDEKEHEGLSEEDKLLKEKLESQVRHLTNKKSKSAAQQKALATLSKEIKSATASMTSVPKPLKFLRPFYPSLVTFYTKYSKNDDIKKGLADVLSVMAMTMAEDGSRDVLEFKLNGNRRQLGEWGHQYVRAMCGEISQEYAARTTSEPPKSTTDLVGLVDEIVPFLFEQNSETEAVDLLFEVNKLERLKESALVDDNNFERVCLYLVRFAEYLFANEDLEAVMGVAFDLYYEQKQYPDALRVAMRLNDMDRITKVMKTVEKKLSGDAEKERELMEKQLALMLGSHKLFAYEVEEDPDVNELVSNESLWEKFGLLAANLNMQEPKSPEAVYKTHLEDGRPYRPEVESARLNLASTFVNGFVNVGFQKDALLIDTGSSDVNWVYKNKSHGMTSAVASLGMVLLWNVSGGIEKIDEYFYLKDDKNTSKIKAGALLATGIVSSGVRDENDPACAVIISEYEKEVAKGNSDPAVKICAALGIGLAHAGNPNSQVKEFLEGIIEAEENPIQLVAAAGFSLGLMYAGTGDQEAGLPLLEKIEQLRETETKQSMARYLQLGLGLIFLGKQELSETTLEVLRAGSDENPVAFTKFSEIMVEMCSYAGTGNVIQVQKLLHLCAEHLDEEGKPITGKPSTETKEEEDAEDAPKETDKEAAAQAAAHQSLAVMGIALITMGEKIGRDMAQRTFQHLLQYGDLAVRRAVPLAMALSHVSEPEYSLIDILSKLTHDQDDATAMSAIMALGIMCAGTTNSRVAHLLRGLATFYAKEANTLFVVRLAQGLLFTGKGLVTLAPYHSDRMLMSPTAIGGILAVMVACLDFKHTILDQYHYLMYTLVCAIRPRMLFTLDEDMQPLTGVKVRVGQAVETVGQAGKPKKITGFQTQDTPVLLNQGDRVELGTDEYEPMTSVLEGLVILKKKKKTVPMSDE